MLKVIKTLVSKQRSAQSTSQINSLSGKVIKSEKFLEQITGARGGGTLEPRKGEKQD
ncbi:MULTISPECIES: hypothetical protein [Pseudoalteromonas]|uniref:Uncharacterized protein n=1 Tax=Pseudoalteromonas phenolica TaxID=161398 RepID=A0A0S2K502_9GAMM|nr:hypothetical protein [Pseudoalteromonas phenolica]ALO43420.1 hypothetical protein PP2015_2937 [Pseudoalteromonas phenolica]MBE0355422.1 hypothetical protein [Pseudoalteromonas phenolica O-BC30]